MKLTVLIDSDSLDEDLISEPGFSAFIRTGGKNILFDTGCGDNLVRNAQKIGINLLKLDYIIFFHGHHDYANGLCAVPELYKNAGSRL